MPLPPLVDEREPGVYVRSERPAGDLDFLWDNDKKQPETPQRNRIGFFAGGFVSGVVVTLVTGILISSAGKIFTPPQVTGPVIVEEQLVQENDFNPSAPQPDSPEAVATIAESAVTAATVAQPTEQAPTEATPTPSSGNTETTANVTTHEGFKVQTYEVQSGDTLGGIAGKFYGETSPRYVEKIKRANSISNELTLQVGQKLVIPPKSYQ